MTGALLGGIGGALIGLGLDNLLNKKKTGTETIQYTQDVEIPETKTSTVKKEVKNVPEQEYCYRLALEEYDLLHRKQMPR